MKGRVLEKAGFCVVRQGKHTVLSDGTRIVTIPRRRLAGVPAT